MYARYKCVSRCNFSMDAIVAQSKLKIATLTAVSASLSATRKNCVANYQSKTSNQLEFLLVGMPWIAMYIKDG